MPTENWNSASAQEDFETSLLLKIFSFHQSTVTQLYAGHTILCQLVGDLHG